MLVTTFTYRSSSNPSEFYLLLVPHVESFVTYDHAINYDHSSLIGCCLKFSHLIGLEGGFQLDGPKFQWL